MRTARGDGSVDKLTSLSETYAAIPKRSWMRGICPVTSSLSRSVIGSLPRFIAVEGASSRMAEAQSSAWVDQALEVARIRYQLDG